MKWFMRWRKPSADEIRLWQFDFLTRVWASGVGQAQAYCWYLEEYGLKGGVKTKICPLCEANRVIRKHGLIPPPDSPADNALHWKAM